MRALFILIILLKWNGLSSGDEINDTRHPLNTAELCRSYGFPTEEHVAKTNDHYELKIFRIPHGRVNSKKTERIPLLVLHGVRANSNYFVLRGANDLALQLVEDGFDVWLGNVRGSRYSMNQHYSMKDNEYWNYSTDDTAQFDLPALVDYVLHQTNKRSLVLLTYSRSGCSSAMFLSDQPAYNRKVQVLFMVAPTLYLENLDVRLPGTIGARLPSFNSTKLYELYKRTNTYKAIEPPTLIDKVTRKIECSTADGVRSECIEKLLKGYGGSVANFNQSLFPRIIDYLADGFSSKEYIQYIQQQESGEFKKFDYGRCNKDHYHTQKPPLYDLAGLTSPVYIYYGPNDRRVSKQNLERLCSEVKDCRKLFQVQDENFGHLDYFLGLNASEIFFPVIRKDINDFHKNDIPEI